MKSLDALAQLKALDAPAFTTNDAATLWKIGRPHASKSLERLAESGHVLRLRRGLWTLPARMDPLLLPACLAAPSPCYVSLQSALYLHGVLSQVPQVIYGISTGRGRVFHTPLGAVSIHHVHPSFFEGYETDTRTGALVATAEKALADLLYLAPARSGLFSSLPELDLASPFRPARVLRFLDRIASPRRRAMATQRWNELASSCE